MSEVVLVVEGTLQRTDVPLLCARLHRLLDAVAAPTVVCDLSALSRADVVTVEAVARLQVTAKRRGAVVTVRGASTDLVDLLALTGLSDVVSVRPASGAGVRGEAEEREQVGVEEVGDTDDPPVGHAE